MSVRDLTSTSATFLREYDAFATTMRDLDPADWERPVRCTDWTVLDLVRHVAPLGVHFAEVIDARAPAEEPLPPAPAVGVCNEPTIAGVTAALEAGLVRLHASMSSVRADEAELVVPGPRGPSPVWVFPIGGIFEIGLHRNDLLWALGQDVDLPEDTARAVFFVVPGLLVAQGRQSPVSPREPICFALAHDGARYLIEHAGGQWEHVLEPSAPVTEIRGSLSSLGLFAFGRVGLDHGLTVGGDERAARAFKTYLPGP